MSEVVEFDSRKKRESHGAIQPPSTVTREEMFGAASVDHRWWAVPAWQHGAYKAQQLAFEQAYGDDFKKAVIEAYGIAASPDGYVLGFEFELSGETVRVALPVTCLDDFCARFMRALESATERRSARPS